MLKLMGVVPPKAKLKMVLNPIEKLPVIIDAVLSEGKELKSAEVGDSSLYDPLDDSVGEVCQCFEDNSLILTCILRGIYIILSIDLPEVINDCYSYC